MLKRIYILTIIALAGLLLVTCNKSKEGDEYPEFVKLNISISSDSGDSVSGVMVCLYDSPEEYELGKSVGNNGLHSVKSAASVNGKVVFDSLLANHDYWILATDSMNFLHYSNEANSSKLDKFTEGSIVSLRVLIEPVTSNISFYALTGSPNVPIRVILGSMAPDTLTTTVSIPSFQPYDPNVLTYSVPAGTYTYQATSKFGCQWIGQVQVGSSEHKTIELEPCQRGIVGIFLSAASINTNKYPLSVYIDGDTINPVGFINAGPSSYTCAPTGGTGTNFVEVYFDPALPITHKYMVKSKPFGTGPGSAACVWMGDVNSVPITAGCNPPVVITGSCP